MPLQDPQQVNPPFNKPQIMGKPYVFPYFKPRGYKPMQYPYPKPSLLQRPMSMPHNSMMYTMPNKSQFSNNTLHMFPTGLSMSQNPIIPNPFNNPLMQSLSQRPNSMSSPKPITMPMTTPMPITMPMTMTMAKPMNSIENNIEKENVEKTKGEEISENSFENLDKSKILAKLNEISHDKKEEFLCKINNLQKNSSVDNKELLQKLICYLKKDIGNDGEQKKCLENDGESKKCKEDDMEMKRNLEKKQKLSQKMQTMGIFIGNNPEENVEINKIQEKLPHPAGDIKNLVNKFFRNKDPRLKNKEGK